MEEKSLVFRVIVSDNNKSNFVLTKKQVKKFRNPGAVAPPKDQLYISVIKGSRG
jgi:hypothetical protein